MSDIKRIAILGLGTIGSSWAGLFASRGLVVRHYDSVDNSDERIRSCVNFLEREGLAERDACHKGLEKLTAAASIEEAVRDADLIQESVTETYEVKHPLLSKASAAAPEHAIIASSSSGLLMTRLQDVIERPERSLIAHPFNPPHLVPLVELVPGEHTSAETLARAREFFESMGKIPVELKKEVPGHIANRLAAALWREAIDLVQSGVASVEDVDKALYAGPGVRWALMGQHMIYHLGGGQGGYRNFIDHIGSSFGEYWKGMPSWSEIPDEAKERVIEGVSDAQGERSMEELAAWRDEKLVKLVKAIYST